MIDNWADFSWNLWSFLIETCMGIIQLFLQWLKLVGLNCRYQKSVKNQRIKKSRKLTRDFGASAETIWTILLHCSQEKFFIIFLSVCFEELHLLQFFTVYCFRSTADDGVAAISVGFTFRNLLVKTIFYWARYQPKYWLIFILISGTITIDIVIIRFDLWHHRAPIFVRLQLR